MCSNHKFVSVFTQPYQNMDASPPLFDKYIFLDLYDRVVVCKAACHFSTTLYFYHRQIPEYYEIRLQQVGNA